MREVVLIQADEMYEPPEQPVLNLSVIGDVTCLSIMTYDQRADGTTMTPIAEVTVSTDQLLLALHASLHATRAITRPPAPKQTTHSDEKESAQ